MTRNKLFTPIHHYPLSLNRPDPKQVPLVGELWGNRWWGHDETYERRRLTNRTGPVLPLEGPPVDSQSTSSPSPSVLLLLASASSVFGSVLRRAPWPNFSFRRLMVASTAPGDPPEWRMRNKVLRLVFSVGDSESPQTFCFECLDPSLRLRELGTISIPLALVLVTGFESSST